MNTVILKADKVGIEKAAELLKAGEVVAIPTETVYGLAANALDSSAIEKIFTAKNRPQDKPVSVHLSDFSEVCGMGLEVSAKAAELAEKYMPGPLTLVLPKTGDFFAKEVSRGLDTVGVRVPDNDVFLEVARLCGFPLAATSANISGGKSPVTAQQVFDGLCGRIPLILDGGDCEVGLDSTVAAVGRDGTVRVLRSGAIQI